MATPKYNRVVLIVRAAADPEIQTFGSGATKTKLRSVISERTKDKDGSWKDAPIWIELEAWNRGNYKLAENMANQIRKGTVFQVEGKLGYDEWQDKNGGGKRSKLFVKVDEFVLISVAAGGEELGRESAKPYSAPADDTESAVDDSIPF